MRPQRTPKIIYFPGVFDLFHIGHLRAMLRAKRVGDTLVVGVQGDESVRRQKGKLPIIRLRDRKAIVAAIRCVDRVVNYRHPDQSRLLRKLRPDMLAVAPTYGRYDPNQKRTLSTAEALGIRVLRIPYSHEVSSSAIKKAVLAMRP